MSGKWTLTGKRVVITGSTKGIGNATAVEMLNLGANVFITARTAEDVTKVVDELKDKYPKQEVRGCACDLSTADGRKALMAAVNGSWETEGVDCLVNNAGVNQRKTVLDTDDELYNRVVQTNMDCTFWLCKMFYPLLQKTAAPCIVNVGSVAGVTSTGSGAPYGMAKAAVAQLTRSLACEWGVSSKGDTKPVRVNCIMPWVTLTPMLTNALQVHPTSIDKAKEWTPLRRPAEPEEIANSIVFLALPASSFVNGQVINVDGGLTANGFAGPTTPE